MLTMAAVRDGVNGAEAPGLVIADESGDWPCDRASRACEMARSIWADVSAGSCCKPVELTRTKLRYGPGSVHSIDRTQTIETYAVEIAENSAACRTPSMLNHI
jgi:hypothetical protein